MPEMDCPVDGCPYKTPDVEAILAAALISAHATVHSAATAGAAVAKTEKVKRPTITSAGTSEDWSYFTSRWGDYVEATRVTGADKVIQLLECCDEQLRKDLTRTAGGMLTGKTEGEVLTAIKKLAVREENTMVARVTLHNMRQDRDEPVRAFGARLRGQAGVCKFSMKCVGRDAEVNYTEAILRDVLCRGLDDSEIQLDLLGDKNQDMTLEQVFQFVEAKESGKRSASRLLMPQRTDALTGNSYRHRRNEARKERHQKTPDAKGQQEACSYCGKRGHGMNAPPKVRRKECPAYGKVRGHCSRSHHVEQMCRSKAAVQVEASAQVDEHEGAIFDSLCGVTDHGPHRGKKSIALEHHLYSQLSDNWVKKPSKPQPFIKLTVRALREDYEHFGLTLSPTPQPSSTHAMADTGCRSCLASIKVFNRLGLTRRDLIPVAMKMHAANNKGITILGAAILLFSGEDRSGGLAETRQITYVTDTSDKLFLGREACIALGMITDKFPTIGETKDDAASATTTTMSTNDKCSTHTHSDSGLTTDCNCPKRTPPPTPPTSLPFPATEENRGRLQQYLIDYYKSSTFNTCEHQPLPLMEGPPLKLMVNTDAEPTAYHSPIPVPLHWQDDVKAGLDRDVRLGVLEPVPVGEPVTWCHRMVICAKKNGKPRQTIDFQPLNVHATRETHHTQSPFHQARSVPHGKKKTVFDAWNGYHSVPIREQDRHLTTFITPWGRYRYCTAPQGYIASGDGYSRRYDEIVSNIPNKTKCIDDTLLWEDDLEGSFHQAVQWQKRHNSTPGEV